jgi:hypothetical protein
MGDRRRLVLEPLETDAEVEAHEDSTAEERRRDDRHDEGGQEPGFAVEQKREHALSRRPETSAAARRGGASRTAPHNLRKSLAKAKKLRIIRS